MPVAKKKVDEPKPEVTFTDEELKVLNEAVAMNALAKRFLDRIWHPIRDKYELKDKIEYDRNTGVVTNDG